MTVISNPSARFEQDVQTFGLRDRELAFSVIGFPQHMQTRACIPPILYQDYKYFKQ